MKIFKAYFYITSIVIILGVSLTSGGIIDLRHLLNYANQGMPQYIVHTNIPANNTITDRGATLGRILFYDKRLSFDNSTSCASCHKQEEDFGDEMIISKGAVGPPMRHAMRLGFAGMSSETNAFWNERAASFEEQATIPVRDGNEMGFSGMFGLPDFDSLLNKLKEVPYYPLLFNFVYGDSAITEKRMQLAMAQFVRSIYAFDSKYDTGRLQVNSELIDFPNFTDQENLGKRLFNTLPKEGGAGCFQCHVPPEFGIDPNTKNNGNIGIIHGHVPFDTLVTKAPSLRNLVTPAGKELKPFMHDGKFKSLSQVVDHYIGLDKVDPAPNQDPRLIGTENDIDLNETEKEAIVAFLHTLISESVFTDEKWSNPFVNDSLDVIPLMNGVSEVTERYQSLLISPNPAKDVIRLGLEPHYYKLIIRDAQLRPVLTKTIAGKDAVNITSLKEGVYFIQVEQIGRHNFYIGKLVKL